MSAADFKKMDEAQIYGYSDYAQSSGDFREIQKANMQSNHQRIQERKKEQLKNDFYANV